MSQRIRHRGLINPTTETLHPLADLCKLLPTRRAYSTLYTWCNYGVEARNGNIYAMESMDVAGVQHSTMEAYHRWVEKCDGE